MTNINILFDSTKVEEIKKAVGNGKETMRRTYPDATGEGQEPGNGLTTALAAFDKAAALATAAGIPAFRPMTAATDENPTPEPDNNVFGPDSIPVLAVVGARERKPDGKLEHGIRAVVLFPMPTAEAFIAGAMPWIAKIVEKESAHVAFRSLRNAESAEQLAAAAAAMPRDVESYVIEHNKGGDGLDTDTFDTLWPEFRKQLKAAMPQLADLLPPKGEVLKAIRSKSYAMGEANIKPLEERGVIQYLGTMMIAAAETWKNTKGDLDPLDTSAIKDWLANRDSLDIKKVEPQEKDFSNLDSIAAALQLA